MDGPGSISPRELFDRLGTAAAPLVFDGRRAAAFDADVQMLVSAQRGAPEHVLCEINVSSCFAIPDEAPAAIAKLVLTRCRERPHR